MRVGLAALCTTIDVKLEGVGGVGGVERYTGCSGCMHCARGTTAVVHRTDGTLVLSLVRSVDCNLRQPNPTGKTENEAVIGRWSVPKRLAGLTGLTALSGPSALSALTPLRSTMGTSRTHNVPGRGEHPC